MLLERQARVGRKLLATGNGRCNLTNWQASPERYHGCFPDFVRPALEAFPVAKVLDFFQTLGLYTATGWQFTFTVPAGCKATADLFGKQYLLQKGKNVITVD